MHLVPSLWVRLWLLVTLVARIWRGLTQYVINPALPAYRTHRHHQVINAAM